MAQIARWETSEPAAPVRRAWAAIVSIFPGMVFTIVLFVFFGSAFAEVSVRHGRPAWIGAVASFFMTFFFLGIVRVAEGARGSRRLRRALRGVPPKRACPARLTLYRDERPYGEDEGIVWFEGGALRFDGLITAFRLVPDDASLLPDAFSERLETGLSGPDLRYGSLLARAAWGFDLVAEPGVRLLFRPVAEPGYGSIHDTLYRWLFTPPHATGETILPPLESRPGYRARKGLLWPRRSP